MVININVGTYHFLTCYTYLELLLHNNANSLFMHHKYQTTLFVLMRRLHINSCLYLNSISIDQIHHFNTFIIRAYITIVFIQLIFFNMALFNVEHVVNVFSTRIQKTFYRYHLMKSMWGDCTKRQQINFQVIFMPPSPCYNNF